MELFLQILKMISGPVIGAVIGYFTNYIAVKMLFHPLHPVKIGKFTLPFTPGIIPKRKPDLAHALGKAVGEQLFTGEDLKAMFSSDATKTAIITAVEEGLCDNERTIDELALAVSTPEGYSCAKDKVADTVGEKLVSALQEVNVGKLLATKGGEAIREKIRSNRMLSMFVSDDLIASLIVPMGQQVNEYIAQHGKELAVPAIRRELDSFTAAPVSETVSSLGITRESIASAVLTVYEGVLVEKLGEFLGKLDIPSVVEEKVNAMDVKELEKLILGVMQKELGAIVNLGALIGFVIGIINIFL